MFHIDLNLKNFFSKIQLINLSLSSHIHYLINNIHHHILNIFILLQLSIFYIKIFPILLRKNLPLFSNILTYILNKFYLFNNFNNFRFFLLDINGRFYPHLKNTHFYKSYIPKYLLVLNNFYVKFINKNLKIKVYLKKYLSKKCF